MTVLPLNACPPNILRTFALKAILQSASFVAVACAVYFYAYSDVYTAELDLPTFAIFEMHTRFIFSYEIGRTCSLVRHTNLGDTLQALAPYHDRYQLGRQAIVISDSRKYHWGRALMWDLFEHNHGRIDNWLLVHPESGKPIVVAAAQCIRHGSHECAMDAAAVLYELSDATTEISASRMLVDLQAKCSWAK